MKTAKKEIEALLRLDFVSFIQRSFHELNPGTEYLHNWHIEVIAHALEQCRTGKSQRLIINVPPRSLKSHIASAFSAFVLGHNPAAQIISVSYAQDLSDKLASDCRSLMQAEWYANLFQATRFAGRRQAISDYTTTQKGFRLSTSVGGVLTGRGADFIFIDDPLKPEEALSEAQRKRANQWFDHTLISRLNDKRSGCIVLIMQRLHEDDLVGHVLRQGGWTVVSFPAIAEADETHVIETPFGRKTFTRRRGEALHPAREPLEVLARIRETQGEYNFASQYQQTPAPLGGGMIKTNWFRFCNPEEQPKDFDFVFQSWDTANKTSELNDFSVCTTWGVENERLYLLHVWRERLDYPSLKRTVKEHAQTYKVTNIVIEDKASGTQLIQDLRAGGLHEMTPYETRMDKVMRMHSVSSTIENGFVYLPADASWLMQYVHEMAVFPNGRYDDQVDSTSQALDWIKNGRSRYGLYEWYREQAMKLGDPSSNRERAEPIVPEPSQCERCGNVQLSRWTVTGLSGDIEVNCNCGWSHITKRLATVRTAQPAVVPTFEQ